MKYHVVEKRNPMEPNAPNKFYANAINIGTVSLRDFAAEIETNSSLSRGDIMNVLESFLEQLPIFLRLGASVSLGNFATLRASLSSEGADVFEDFSANNIKRVRIVFTPSRELKRSMEGISFERVDL